jgi:hypothetical protein
VERMESGPGFQFGLKMGWRELSPSLMRRSVSLTRVDVGMLLWRRAQKIW